MNVIDKTEHSAHNWQRLGAPYAERYLCSAGAAVWLFERNATTEQLENEKSCVTTLKWIYVLRG